MRLAAFDGPSTKTPILAQKSHTQAVIANFVPNFVAMATGVDREKMQNWQHSMAHP